MPDIQMCPSTICARRTTCRRNKASGTVPSEWQAWGDYSARENGDCDEYWPREQESAP